MKLVLLIAAIVVTAECTPFQNCGKSDAKEFLKSVELEGCSGSKCLLKKGSSYNVKVDFASNVDSNILTVEAFANVFGVVLPWPGLDKNACVGNNINCPVKKGNEYNYKLNFDVKSMYPTLSTDVVFKMRGDNKKEVFCFKLAVAIED